MEYTIERIPLKTVTVPEIDSADVPAYCEALKRKARRKASRKARTAAPEVEIADERASVVVRSSEALADVARHFIDNSVGVSFSTIFAYGESYYQLFFDCTQERAKQLIEELNAKDNTTK